MRFSRWVAASLACTFAFVAVVLFGDWLIRSDVSPLHHYLLWHPAVGNAWMGMNRGPLLLGFAFSGNVHQPSMAGFMLGFVLQWGFLGALLSLFVVGGPESRTEWTPSPARGRSHSAGSKRR